MNIGIIGCGNISTAYLRLAPQFKNVSVTACSDLDDSVAQAQASTSNCKALSIDALLADPDIDVVINLTVPAAHADVSKPLGGQAHLRKVYWITLMGGKVMSPVIRISGMSGTKLNHSLRIRKFAPDFVQSSGFNRFHQCRW